MDKRPYNTINWKRDRELLLLLGVGLCISGFLFLIKNFPKSTHLVSPLGPFPAVPPVPTIDPSTIPQTTSFDASDGKATLFMKEQKIAAGIAYTFTTKKPDGTPVNLFSKTIQANEQLSIPFNSWSPDDKYLFLKEETATKTNYYVMLSSGAALAPDTQYLNITDIFAQKLPDYQLVDVTGWASPTLLIVNTKTKQGADGPSFWFEIPSKSFIQLATKFY